MPAYSILLASANRGKLVEFKEVAALYPGLRLISADQLEHKLGAPPDVKEIGKSYAENAELKARAFFEWSRTPSLADDTGLEVDSLNAEPGLYSARYAGEPTNPKRNIEKLLKSLEAERDRSAKFICILVLKISAEEELTQRAELQGKIALSPAGGGGFGYDSVFIPQGQKLTLAEIKEQAIPFDTHRALAAKALLSRLIAAA